MKAAMCAVVFVVATLVGGMEANAGCSGGRCGLHKVVHIKKVIEKKPVRHGLKRVLCGKCR